VANRPTDSGSVNWTTVTRIAGLLRHLQTDDHFHGARQRANGGAVPGVEPRGAVEIAERQLNHFRGNDLSGVGEGLKACARVGEFNRHLVAFHAREPLHAAVRDRVRVSIADGALEPGRPGYREEVRH
jgi:hypothetical protein